MSINNHLAHFFPQGKIPIMNTLWTNLPQFLRTATWRATTCVSLCLPMMNGLGCADTQNTKPLHSLHHTPEATLTPLATFTAPNQVVIQGQKNALMHFMAKKWQLKSINHIPVGRMVIVDLTNFAKSQGMAYTDCDEIFFEMDTQKILSGSLMTVNLERKMTNCTHNLGDDVMRILGDLHSFSHQDGILTLISLKDKIELVAMP